ncbi:cellulase family glycosylhydrolase [Chryseosolibacter indicus]|uniref:Cellulase family glycosylhydrolase n=1 Tax=Chryseosolibacter indicus TaxID=2782351 RepID=A0ABS5VWG1_9BACT|nr:cellulase family glycosylhydrolase [Chryseosolibacter indicus]MBT1705170.1 cellulase family glycosylhydrolase [Chryseosolibacter indicus]
MHTRQLCSFYILFFLLFITQAFAQVSWLHVNGNQIVDEAGNVVTLRGVSVLAPEHNNECTTCNRKPISEMLTWQADASAGWNSRVVRLQVTTAKVSDPAKSFAAIIDPYVQQAIAKGLYIIVDLHFVSNFDYNGSGGISQEQVLEFWNYVAPRYANTPNVIFEVFNEPISPDCWTCWKEFIQPVIQNIRAVAPNLILVGNPQWSTRVNQAVTDPIAGNDLVYVYHIYPNQGAASENNLNSKFGTAAQSIPVMITEFGWNQHANYSDGVTNGTTSGWGVPFRQYIDARPHISWTGYIFDNYWKPQYFDWNWNLMGGENQGQFLQDWLKDTRDNNQPQPSGVIAHAVTSHQINLSWSGVNTANNYTVSRSFNSGGPYVVIASGVTSTTYSDTTAIPATTYYYTITSNGAGGTATIGSPVSATTEGVGFTPDIPLFLVATGGNAQVSLSWGASVGASGYNIKRSSTKGGPYTVIASNVTNTTYTDSNVTNGTIYYYVVSAVGEKVSRNSAETSDVPSSIVLINDNNTAALTGSWSSSTGSPGYYGADYLQDGNTGVAGGKKARYSPNLPLSGNYHVSIRWTSAPNRASNVPIQVNHAGGTTDLFINQRHNGSTWVELGSFNFNAGTTGNIIILNDRANGYVVADAVKFALRSEETGNNPPTAHFSTNIENTDINVDAIGSSDADGNIVAYAWNFGDGETGSGINASHTYSSIGSYIVTLTVTDDDGSTDAHQDTVFINGTSQGITTTVNVNQKQNGGTMQVLGNFYFDSGTNGFVRIRTDFTNGYVVADAVKFSKSGQSDIVLDNSSTSGVAIEGAWTTSSASPGYQGTNYLHDGNTGKGSKRVTYTPSLPVNGEWTVSVRWTSDPNRATNVPIDIVHSSAPTSLTSISEQQLSNQGEPFALYPNPARTLIKVNFPDNYDSHINIKIIDPFEVVLDKKGVSASDEIKIDNLKPGLYTVIINTTKETFTKKLVIE